MSKKLGKIARVKFGIGGYQESCLGIFFTLDFKGCGAMDSWSTWDAEKIKVTEYTKWTEETRSADYADIMRKISKLLHEAKVESVEDLKGVPIEAEFKDLKLVSWRVLEEVL